ncbi:MAG: hypothetical protein JW791_00885 [Nanoarchaeota archaeon]|nr:hypothetical protein [Nanoarchaeota archaeon]
MATFFDYLNEIVSGIVLTGEPVTGIGGIFFILIFLLIFALTFTASAYIPMFAKKEEYKNIRMIIALSISFLTAITFYNAIVEQIQFFGLVTAIALGISVGLLAVIPKKYRDKEGSSITSVITAFSIIAAIIITLILLDMTGWVPPVINFVTSAWTDMFTTGSGWWVLIIIIAVVFFIMAIIRGMARTSP